MWLANQTRPDVANAIRVVARYSNSPKEAHCKAVIVIFEYVFCTSDFGITFERGGGLELVAFADANYASKATDRRSVSGGAVMCAGASVSWFSRTQKCVTLSTTEAEYVALADTIKEAMFSRYVWCFIFPGLAETCITILEDNERVSGTEPSAHVELEAHRLATPFPERACVSGRVCHCACTD